MYSKYNLTEFKILLLYSSLFSQMTKEVKKKKVKQWNTKAVNQKEQHAFSPLLVFLFRESVAWKKTKTHLKIGIKQRLRGSGINFHIQPNLKKKKK